MPYIVKTDLERAKEYTGKGVATMVGSKKHTVVFRVSVDDFTLEEAVSLYKRDRNIVMLDYVGTLEYLSTCSEALFDGVYVGRKIDVGSDVFQEDIEGVLSKLPQGVTLVVGLPDDYSDMEFVYNMSHKYPNVRFCGGNLFLLEGCNIGCCDSKVLSRASLKYKDIGLIRQGCGCDLQVLVGSEIELVETSKGERNKGTRTSSRVLLRQIKR